MLKHDGVFSLGYKTVSVHITSYERGKTRNKDTSWRGGDFFHVVRNRYARSIVQPVTLVSVLRLYVPHSTRTALAIWTLGTRGQLTRR